jgi:NodT family efflux transporter outer membrane factor (OMF) lipoprotein
MNITSRSRAFLRIYCLVAVFFFLNACTMVGPDFVRPPADVPAQWPETEDPRVQFEPTVSIEWWKVFNDPVLDRLVQAAYGQNLPLRAAGVRVLEARARLGVAVGELYPQNQQGFGSLTALRQSERAPNAPQVDSGDVDFSYRQAELGGAVSWEIDFWGRFRRAVQSADATFLSSIADYDDVLVSLTAEVARSYLLIRTFEERIRIARENVAIQQESLRIARTRFELGATSERDVQQALTQLSATESSIPLLEAGLRQVQNALSILLGMPPDPLQNWLSGSKGIPQAPATVAVDIPADLLRRRPDIRSAELEAAAQCARIGVAKADLYPAFSLSGSFGFLSSDVGRFELGDLFLWKSRSGFIGPAFQWNLFNYGQITNRVRVQDALFQEALIGYQDTVLRAQQEVSDGLVEFLKGQERLGLLERAAEAARSSADLALIQYREGATDYTTVITAQAALLEQQDRLAVGRGDVPRGLVAVYRALGGGWQIREGKPFVPPETAEEMGRRTDWGRLLTPEQLRPFDAEEEGRSIGTPDW